MVGLFLAQVPLEKKQSKVADPFLSVSCQEWRHEFGSDQGPISVPEGSKGSKIGCQCRLISISYDL
jgi:hypothetical protein